MKQYEIEFYETNPDVAWSQPGMIWKPRDATPEEQKEWINTENKYWSDIIGKLIISLSILQVSLFGMMLGCMWILQQIVRG